MRKLTTDAAAAIDPITALLARDWASFGGWSLLIGFLVVWIGVGSFREWWVPGPRYRRQEDLLLKSTELNREQSAQIERLIQGNELTKHFFESVMPTNRHPANHEPAPTPKDETEKGGD